MPKLFCLCQMQGGVPNVDFEATPVAGYVLCERAGTHGAYLMSGTGAQLTTLNALPAVVGIVVVTEGTPRWAEIDGVVSATVRTKLNTWLAANHPAWPTVPAGASYRQVITALYARFHSLFDLARFDVSEGS